MNGTGSKLLGVVVWRDGNRYLRRRLSSRCKLIVRLAGGASVVVGAALFVRRLAG